MKKEIFAVVLITALAALSLYNTHHIDKTAEDICTELSLSAALAKEGDIKSAEAHATAAKEIWDGHAWYFESILRHTEFDTVCEDFYNVSEKLLDGDGAKAALYVEHAKEHLRTIADMEKVRVGTIF